MNRRSPGWAPRELPKKDQDALWLPLKTLGKVLVRKAGVPVTLRRTDNGARTVLRWGKGGAEAAGLPSELVVFCYGREQAQVELTGDEHAIAALTGADRGL